MAADIAMFYEDPNKLAQRKLMLSSFDHDMARIALVAEVTLSHNNAIQISHVYVAIDCGIVVDPSGVRAQVEGGIAFGLTPLLKGGVSLKNGRVAQSNFHDYALLRFDEMPLVTVDIVPSNEPPLGVAEASVPMIAPAVCNAIYALIGHRFRTLPLNLLYLST
jgi:isoquinoline 1-oxidoreductase subunit beta